MITIFTNPRPFRGHIDIIQRNAIKSWLLLRPKCEIIIFNDEENTSTQVAGEYGLKCITDVKCNEYGTPLLNDVFAKVKKIARFDIVAQVNSDIILLDSFTEAVKRVKDKFGTIPFFMVGRRWDLDVPDFLDFGDDWQRRLLEKARKDGQLHGLAGIDYWVFPRSLPFDPPPFVIGRPGMDNWLVYKARCLKAPVIDATDFISIVHQNHNYPKKNERSFKLEKNENFRLAGNGRCLLSVRDAGWLLTKNGLERPKFPRRIYSLISLWYPWRATLALKRRIQLVSEQM